MAKSCWAGPAGENDGKTNAFFLVENGDFLWCFLLFSCFLFVLLCFSFFI